MLTALRKLPRERGLKVDPADGKKCWGRVRGLSKTQVENGPRSLTIQKTMTLMRPFLHVWKKVWLESAEETMARGE